MFIGAYFPFFHSAAAAELTAPRAQFWLGSETLFGDWSSWAGAQWAPTGDLWRSGFRLRAAVGRGGYSYDMTDGRNQVAFDFLEAAPGRQWVLGNLSVSFFAGLSLEDHRLARTDPAHGAEGRSVDLKLQLENWLTLPDQGFISLNGGYSVFSRNYAARLATGKHFDNGLGAGVFLGAKGAEDYQDWRAGGEFSYRAGSQSKLSLAVGYAKRKAGQEGIFVGVNLLQNR